MIRVVGMRDGESIRLSGDVRLFRLPTNQKSGQSSRDHIRVERLGGYRSKMADEEVSGKRVNDVLEPMDKYVLCSSTTSSTNVPSGEMKPEDNIQSMEALPGIAIT